MLYEILYSRLSFYHSAMNERMDKRGFKTAEEMNEYISNKGMAGLGRMTKL
ncbi:MAG: hypothetical protein ACLRHW_19925 [Coprobacillus cateniformis]